MQSLRSRLIIGLIKNRQLFRFKIRRERIDESFSVKNFRESTEKAAMMMNRKFDDKHRKIAPIDGIYGEWIDVDASPENKVILYIHGGGFISGSCETHRTHVLKFAKASGVRALLFNYRLAPEHPFPAAIEDCLAAYRWLLSNGYKAQDIVIAGESAGGTLTLSTLKLIKEKNMDQPAGAVSISPVTDLSCTADSFTRNQTRDIAPLGSMNIWTQNYIGKSDPLDPLLSPAFGDHTGLAKTLLVVGTNEIHLDDTLLYYKKVIEAGSEAILLTYEKMVHAFPIMAPLFPEASKALSEIAEFICDRLKIRGK